MNVYRCTGFASQIGYPDVFHKLDCYVEAESFDDARTKMLGRYEYIHLLSLNEESFGGIGAEGDTLAVPLPISGTVEPAVAVAEARLGLAQYTSGIESWEIRKRGEAYYVLAPGKFDDSFGGLIRTVTV